MNKIKIRKMERLMKKHTNHFIIIIGFPLIDLILEKGVGYSVDWNSVWQVDIGVIILTILDVLFHKFRK